MNEISVFGIILCAALLIALLVLPVSEADTMVTVTGTRTFPATAATGQPFIPASATPEKATAGEPVTISGVAVGGTSPRVSRSGYLPAIM